MDPLCPAPAERTVAVRHPASSRFSEATRFKTCGLRWLIPSVVVSAGVWLLVGGSEASTDEEAWRPILTKEVYQELAKREADLIQELLKDVPKKLALNRAKFGTVLIAALTMSVQDGFPADELHGTRETALMLANALNNKDQFDAARKLAAQLPDAKVHANANFDINNLRGYVDAPTLMYHFLPKNEGGDGIHPDLQSTDQLKGRKNGILEKIRDLTTNELTAAAMKKEAKELELFSYRSAVIGSLVYYLVPAKMKVNKTPEEWRNLAIQMRDHSVNMAVAAQKGDTAAVLKASISLRSACSKCHNVF
jgi:hypothetical protein